jgi:hypothetical protein
LLLNRCLALKSELSLPATARRSDHGQEVAPKATVLLRSWYAASQYTSALTYAGANPAMHLAPPRSRKPDDQKTVGTVVKAPARAGGFFRA